ncbi:MAG: tryptophan--tRNA ligase [Alphaproteobacteria bacterium]|nr:tryptophan--tRNA ligase [Alphaproteobacteria bacterium]
MKKKFSSSPKKKNIKRKVVKKSFRGGNQSLITTPDIITGIKPTGSIHLGNYFGAILPLLKISKGKKVFAFVADLHALTNTTIEPETLQKDITHILCAWEACGAGDSNVIVYRQSDYPQITFLQWVLTQHTTLSTLQLGHAYKDATMNKHQTPVLGVLLYPILMSADILISGAGIVPVGQDQVQHIEMARDMARKYNSWVGKNYFIEPKSHVVESEALKGIDGRKMSKSYNNTIPIFGSEEEVRKKIMSIQTGSVPLGKPIQHEDCLVFYFHTKISPAELVSDLRRRYAKGSIGYREAKELLFESFLKYFKKERMKYNELMAQKNIGELLAKKHYNALTVYFDDRLGSIKKLTGFSAT